jgi:hypothetical protein
MSDLELTEEQAREERLRLVDRRAHWAYLLAVLGGATALMIVLIALLDATT